MSAPAPLHPSAVALRLHDGDCVYVDPRIAAEYGHLRWHRRRKDRDYVSATLNGRNVYLHRLVMGAKPNEYVHHRNGHPLHCWRENLEIVTAGQNARARRMTRIAGKTSQYHGVSWSDRRQKWHVRVTLEYKTHLGGFFDCEIAAARARDELAMRLHGPHASLNFQAEMSLRS